MYFYHRKDPVHFQSSCAVSTIPAVYMNAGALLRKLKRNPGLAGRLAIPYDIGELEKAVKKGEDLSFNCGRLDDLCTVALYYLDRPGGRSPLCTKDVCCSPAWRWPEEEAKRKNE